MPAVIQRISEPAVELTPSERAVLGLIRQLIFEDKSPTIRVTTLRSRWPVLHVGAYEIGYEGLRKKFLIAVSPDGQTLRIPNVGR
jgi:hypothetical protein